MHVAEVPHTSQNGPLQRRARIKRELTSMTGDERGPPRTLESLLQ
jgi:hypothetical protein